MLGFSAILSKNVGWRRTCCDKFCSDGFFLLYQFLLPFGSFLSLHFQLINDFTFRILPSTQATNIYGSNAAMHIVCIIWRHFSQFTTITIHISRFSMCEHNSFFLSSRFVVIFPPIFVVVWFFFLIIYGEYLRMNRIEMQLSKHDKPFGKIVNWKIKDRRERAHGYTCTGWKDITVWIK